MRPTRTYHDGKSHQGSHTEHLDRTKLKEKKAAERKERKDDKARIRQEKQDKKAEEKRAREEKKREDWKRRVDLVVPNLTKKPIRGELTYEEKADLHDATWDAWSDDERATRTTRTPKKPKTKPRESKKRKRSLGEKQVAEQVANANRIVIDSDSSDDESFEMSPKRRKHCAEVAAILEAGENEEDPYLGWMRGLQNVDAGLNRLIGVTEGLVVAVKALAEQRASSH